MYLQHIVDNAAAQHLHLQLVPVILGPQEHTDTGASRTAAGSLKPRSWDVPLGPHALREHRYQYVLGSLVLPHAVQGHAGARQPIGGLLVVVREEHLLDSWTGHNHNDKNIDG